MNQLIPLFILVLLFSSPVIADKIEKPPLEVLYIANEGFLIECAGKKIVIDGFFGGFESQWYYMPPDSAVEQMKAAQRPFDSIDVIAVTHRHRDHFDAGIVAAHMNRNPQAILICPPQVAEELALTEPYPDIKDQIRIVPAPGNSAVEMVIAGIKLVVFPTRHGPYMETDTLTGERVDRHRNVQHLEFLLSINGWTLFHCGDSPMNSFEMYRSSALYGAKLDVAFLQGRTRGLFTTDRLIVMHLSPGRESKPLPDDYQKEAREVIAARRPMVRWVFR